MKGYDCIINIADNASTDNSLKIARKLAGENKKIKYIHLNKKGRGRAIKKAWNNSKADYLAYMDVDLSTDLKSFPNLISALKENDIAIGSRLMSKSKVIGRTLKREILSRIYNILIKLFFQTQFSDAQCGFKAINKKIAQNLLPSIEDNAWFFDSELLIIGEKLGYKIHEEPVFWIDNPGSTVRVLKTVQGDLEGLLRLFIHRPWKDIRRKI
jgi:glycosyltransferase involved in cell wall biosynthesis